MAVESATRFVVGRVGRAGLPQFNVARPLAKGLRSRRLDRVVLLASLSCSFGRIGSVSEPNYKRTLSHSRSRAFSLYPPPVGVAARAPQDIPCVVSRTFGACAIVSCVLRVYMRCVRARG